VPAAGRPADERGGIEFGGQGYGVEDADDLIAELAKLMAQDAQGDRKDKAPEAEATEDKPSPGFAPTAEPDDYQGKRAFSVLNPDWSPRPSFTQVQSFINAVKSDEQR
jgi:hypothetical protein